jgi:putative ABC transport system permease protein
MPLRPWLTLGWLGDGWQYLRLTTRFLGRTPGFTSIVLLVIALGIGVKTAVFSVVDAVLLKPLTYPDPQALVQLVTTSDRDPIPVASIPEYNIWQQQSTIFQQVAGYGWGGAGMNLSGGDRPEQVLGIHATAGYFALLGAPVVAGRTFTASEDSPNGGHVVVLSYGLWKRRIGANPNIVGSTIKLDDQSWLVVGVIGRDFVTDTPVDLWIPFQFDLNSREMARNFNVVARLKPGITAAQANAQLALATQQFCRIYGSNALPPQGPVQSSAAARVFDWQHPIVTDSPARSRGVRASHRLRQRSQSPAWASLGPKARTRNPCGSGSRARTDHSATPD